MSTQCLRRTSQRFRNNFLLGESGEWYPMVPLGSGIGPWKFDCYYSSMPAKIMQNPAAMEKMSTLGPESGNPKILAPFSKWKGSLRAQLKAVTTCFVWPDPFR